LVVLRYWRKDIAIIHSNGVEDLIPAVILKAIHPSAKLIYDAHELESERSGWPGYNKKIAAWVEQWFIRRADVVFVVSSLIGSWYQDRYRLDNVKVVRNIPDQSSNGIKSVENIRDRIGAEATDSIFLYQGAFFEGRGLEAIVAAFTQVPATYKLILLGYGRLEPYLRQLAAGATNIFFLPPAHPEEILAFTKQADVGLCLIEDTSLSYRYCLPNKLFEYIQAGIPVLVSNLPELSNFVVSNKCGWVVAIEAREIQDTIVNLNQAVLSSVKQQVGQAAALNTWQLERREVEIVYQRLTSNGEA
jgi:glycosyltransferase involved in cell wall biosynthesis